MTSRPAFPLVWDNTMRVCFISCARRFFWEYLHHWKPKVPSIHLHAGAAWAKGLEITRRAFYVDHRSPDESLALGLQALIKEYGTFDAPPDSPKSLERLAQALPFYFENYPLATDPAQPYAGSTGPMIEFSFALPLDASLLHPETGEPIIFAGRTDMIATFAGAVTIFDDKTTTSLGSSWAAQWDMRSQFSGYSWAAQQHGIPASQILVRGIGLLKSKFTTQQAITHRIPHRIARWHFQIVRDIRRAMAMWKEGYWDYDEAEACNSYGGCMFRQPCATQDPAPWLETYFTKRVWDPISRKEHSDDIPA